MEKEENEILVKDSTGMIHITSDDSNYDDNILEDAGISDVPLSEFELTDKFIEKHGETKKEKPDLINYRYGNELGFAFSCRESYENFQKDFIKSGLMKENIETKGLLEKYDGYVIEDELISNSRIKTVHKHERMISYNDINESVDAFIANNRNADNYGLSEEEAKNCEELLKPFIDSVRRMNISAQIKDYLSIFKSEIPNINFGETKRKKISMLVDLLMMEL